MSPHHPFMRSQDQSGERGVGQDLDNIFRLTATAAAAQRSPETARPAPESRRVPQPDLDAALEMLNRAAKAMDVMQSRYQHIEDYAKGVADRAEKDIAVAYAQAREWEVRASGSEGKLEDLRTRAEAAECRADAAERAAAESREWLERFYEKIVTSFDTRAFLKSQAA